MDDLVEFLRARLDELAAPRKFDAWHESFCLDESARNRDGSCFYCGAFPDPTKIEEHAPSDDALRDIGSKRHAVDACAYWLHESDAGWLDPCADAVLRALATAHADHPDYRQEWTP